MSLLDPKPIAPVKKKNSNKLPSIKEKQNINLISVPEFDIIGKSFLPVFEPPIIISEVKLQDIIPAEASPEVSLLEEHVIPISEEIDEEIIVLEDDKFKSWDEIEEMSKKFAFIVEAKLAQVKRIDALIEDTEHRPKPKTLEIPTISKKTSTDIKLSDLKVRKPTVKIDCFAVNESQKSGSSLLSNEVSVPIQAESASSESILSQNTVSNHLEASLPDKLIFTPVKVKKSAKRTTIGVSFSEYANLPEEDYLSNQKERLASKYQDMHAPESLFIEIMEETSVKKIKIPKSEDSSFFNVKGLLPELQKISQETTPKGLDINARMTKPSLNYHVSREMDNSTEKFEPLENLNISFEIMESDISHTGELKLEQSSSNEIVCPRTPVEANISIESSLKGSAANLLSDGFKFADDFEDSNIEIAEIFDETKLEKTVTTPYKNRSKNKSWRKRSNLKRGRGKKLWKIVENTMLKASIGRKFGENVIKPCPILPTPLPGIQEQQIVKPPPVKSKKNQPKVQYQTERIQKLKDKSFYTPESRVKTERPVIGLVVNAERLAEQALKIEQIEFDTNFVKLQSNILSQSISFNRYGYGSEKSMYDTVHNIKRRLSSLNSIERAKYPTFEDIGPKIGSENPKEPYLPPESEILEELQALNKTIDNSKLPVPTNFRRRAFLYAHTKRFKMAMDDIEKSLSHDPFNCDALWLRHLLLLRLNDIESAIGDLDTITSCNKLHVGAFQAKARIYQSLGLITLSIVSYSNVIKQKHDSADAYYARAVLFQARKDFTFASEDFRTLRSLDPTNEDAVFDLAINNFKKHLWNEAISSFGKLIQFDPENSKYHVYRARAAAHIGKFTEALEILNNVVIMDPDCAEAYFYRGCIFQNVNPTAAIENLSLTLLVSDSELIAEAYFIRAKIYERIRKFDLAIQDYENAIDCDETLIKALINLGLLYLREFGEYSKAYGCFNSAISIKPTSIRGYLCRGEYYEKMLAEENKLLSVDEDNQTRHKRANKTNYTSAAIKEYSKAIHLSPTKYLLYLHRGSLLMSQKYP